MFASKFILAAAAFGCIACAATPVAPFATAQTAVWRINPAACPDLIEDRIDRRENVRDRREDRRDRAVNRGPLDRAEDRLDSRENRRDRREDRRDARVINCPASAYTFIGTGLRPVRPTRIVYTGGTYYGEAANGRRVVVVVNR